MVHSSGLLPELAASSAEGATSASSVRPSESPEVQTQSPSGLTQHQQVRRRIFGKQAPSEFEINMINSLKQGIFEINEKSINSDQEEVAQELQLLQDLRLQEWYQGDLQGYSEKEVKEAIKKEFVSLSSSGPEVDDPVPLRLPSKEDQAKVIESRWVIRPRSGVLKARFVGKGFTQVIDKEAKYAHAPQATTLKIILMMSQPHKWCLAVSDVASAFLSTPVDESKGSFTFRLLKIQYPEPTVWCLKRQWYGLRDSPRSCQYHVTQVLKRMNLSQTKSDPCAFTGVDASGHVNLIVHGICRRPHCLRRVIFSAEILSGDSEDVQSQAHRLPDSRSSDWVPRQSHQEEKVRSIHNGVFSEVHRQFARVIQSHDQSHHKWCQDPNDPKRGSSQVWQGELFTIQDRSRQTFVDGTTQRWHQTSSQGVVKVFVKSPGIRLGQSQASPRACQSDTRLHLRHGASDSSPKCSRTHSSWDHQLFRFGLGRISKIKEIN